ncbi:MAG: host-nuclease inhibitor Gam family protein [Rhodospirillales bacterium]|jgi:phage host-nuclease inhibitor protein Gam|nr:host-nuclease inhibitor Gam family protein [Rhodospirillales bacterium]
MRTKTKALTIPAPQSRDECSAAIARLGTLQRERQRIEADMNDRLAEIKDACEGRAKPIGDEIGALARAIQAFCEANRASLAGEKVKYHRFAAGAINWRRRPPKVTVRGAATVIAALRRLGLDRFIRVKEEVNKEAMLAEPEVASGVAGVSIGSEGEDFVITPNETELDEVAS